MNKARYVLIVKHTVYCLLFLILYIIQTVPGLFALRDAKPVWVIPAAIALAMFEGEFQGGIYGALAGLLCDMGGFLLFGFSGFLSCLYCVATGLLVIYLMRCNMLGCVLFVFCFMVLRGSLEFLFSYGMWGYENVWKIYFSKTLPVAVMSTATAPVMFLLFRKLHRKFESLLK